MNKTCEFCGQVVEVDPANEAWEVCSCTEAIDKRKAEAGIVCAIEGIDRIFGEESEKRGFTSLPADEIEMLKSLAEAIGRGRANVVTIKLPNGGTATLKKDGWDIKVIRKEQKTATA